jgi:hypothetical protein
VRIYVALQDSLCNNVKVELWCHGLLVIHLFLFTKSQIKHSALDPAGPLFENEPPITRIDPSDASYVQCIHTNGIPLVEFGFGTLEAWGHVDFYPNGGQLQPGCKEFSESIFIIVSSI